MSRRLLGPLRCSNLKPFLGAISQPTSAQCRAISRFRNALKKVAVQPKRYLLPYLNGTSGGGKAAARPLSRRADGVGAAAPGPRRAVHPPPVATGDTEEIPLNVSRTVTYGEMLWEMAGYIWPRDRPDIKLRVLASLSLLVGSKLTTLCVPILFKNTVDSVLHSPTPLDLSPLVWVALFTVCRVAASAMNEARNAVFAKVAQSSIRRVSGNVFGHLLNLDLGFHLSRKTGALSKAIDRGTRGINFVMSALVFNILPITLEFSMVVGYLWWNLGAAYSGVTAMFTLLYAIATVGITQWRIKFRHDMNRADQKAGSMATDSLMNYETVKYFNNERFEARNYDRVLGDYEVAALKNTTSLSALNFSQQLIISSAVGTLMYMTTRDIMAGSMTVGDLVLVNGLLLQLAAPLNFLGTVYREVRQSLIDMQTMFTLMEQSPQIVEKPLAPALVVAPSSSSIRFDRVHFGYHADRPILRGLSLDVPSGRKVAIVGGSGSGKSTLIRLLFRFIEADSGRILVNGQDIRDVTLQSVRKALAVVPQDTILFHDTIDYNIQYGDPLKSHQQMVDAARMAEIHAQILDMPLGYRTIVGERGLKLSGGEKQRVSIARALLKDAPILVYDEATSHLDSLTERRILDALSRATANRTTIVIAHRLSTVVDSDMICVLEDGVLADQGTHLDLLRRSSLYNRLWAAQQSSQADDSSSL